MSRTPFSNNQPEPPASGQEQGLLSHLVELRDRLIRVVLCLLLVFCGLVFFAQELYHYIAKPMLEALPNGTSMIAIDVASSFLIPLKVTFIISILICVPYILYQAWAFVAPGLYKHERKLAAPLVISSSLLFYLGSAFAYFVVLPQAFAFFVKFAPQGVEMMTDVSRYIDFVLSIFFAFGVAFEVPVVAVLAVLSGMTTPKQLGEIRPYVVVVAFIVGMLLTPPDIISQTLLAVPMLFLYEFGILMSKVMLRNTPGNEEKESDDENVS